MKLAHEKKMVVQKLKEHKRKQWIAHLVQPRHQPQNAIKHASLYAALQNKEMVPALW